MCVCVCVCVCVFVCVQERDKMEDIITKRFYT